MGGYPKSTVSIAFSACPLAMHIILLRAVVLSPDGEEDKGKGALEIVHLLPTKSHWFVAFQGLLLL